MHSFHYKFNFFKGLNEAKIDMAFKPVKYFFDPSPFTRKEVYLRDKLEADSE